MQKILLELAFDLGNSDLLRNSALQLGTLSQTVCCTKHLQSTHGSTLNNTHTDPIGALHPKPHEPCGPCLNPPGL